MGKAFGINLTSTDGGWEGWGLGWGMGDGHTIL